MNDYTLDFQITLEHKLTAPSFMWDLGDE